MNEIDRVWSPHPQSGLSTLQTYLVTLFLESAESAGYVLVGGGALIAHGLVDRRTQDLDFFNTTGSPEADVRIAANAFAGMCARLGLVTRVLTGTTTFSQVAIAKGKEEVVVDFALDAPLVDEWVQSPVGRTPSLTDLAAMKLLALFSRAAPRDFIDVHRLAQLLGREAIVMRALKLDSGFSLPVLADALRAGRRIPDDRFPVAVRDVGEVRAFFEEWLVEIQAAQE